MILLSLNRQDTKMRTQTKHTKKSWKEKAMERGDEARRLKQELKRQKNRAMKWRKDYYRLKRTSKLTKVENYNYPLELIWMAILMHVNFNVSLRGVSQSLMKLGRLYKLKFENLSHMTIRNWCLKFGLFRLSDELSSGKYILISDESVEIGRERLLLLYVVPIENYSSIVPLSMEDVKVLDLGVQTVWNSDDVAAKIKEKTEQFNLEIVYGISDNCSKLKKAMKICNIKWIADCTHEIANVSKALYRKDEESNRFITKMSLLRSKWILSKHLLLVPPKLRSKDRFNQMFVIHKWAERIINDWDDISQEAKKELRFVQQNKELIKSMRQCYDIIDLFCSIFKSKGIQENSLKEWDEKIAAYKCGASLNNKPMQLVEKMNDYLARQQLVLPQETQILCCSDIIESTFGKYKNKGVKIITDDVLKIAGYSSQTTMEEIQRAMQQIKTAQVAEWKKENTTISKLALLKRKKKCAA